MRVEGLLMMHIQDMLTAGAPFFLCAPTILYLAASAVGSFVPIRRHTGHAACITARIVSSTVLIISLLCCIYAAFHAGSLTLTPSIFSLGPGYLGLSFRLDMVGVLMLLLITFLGWIIISYSCAYMEGDTQQARYIQNLLQTLSAVSLLVVTNNLVVFLVAWILTSLSLHRLLTLYPERQLALIAAHKKFLASRLGDISLLSGITLLGSQTGSLQIDEVLRRVAGLHSTPGLIHIAATLLAISALIKCAQLPLHGWLIQVMEAPTPVSALLHAGVVNLGGFMLIRFAPIIETTSTAADLLVVVGCLTAAISSLVMTTRISIKVHLAWSTCAQMGFMLLECGLGLYHLAFVHLLAHSLYKAYAFLSSGNTVVQTSNSRMSPPRSPLSLTSWIVSGCAGILLAMLAVFFWRQTYSIDLRDLFCIAVVGLATASLLAAIPAAHGIGGSLKLAMLPLGISLLYFGFDIAFKRLVPGVMEEFDRRRSLIFAVTCFILLYATQATVRAKPMGRLANAIYPWLYAGLYLDELFTRATFQIWPARQPSQRANRRDASQAFEIRGASL